MMRWLRKGQPTKKRFTRIFFVTDIHGSETCFLKFLNAASFYEADVLVLGGDITGKQIVTIEQQGDTYRCWLFGQEREVHGATELGKLLEQIRMNGFYPYVTTPEELQELEADPNKVDALFARLMTETVERWIQLAEERLRGRPVKCFISPGNDDQFVLDPILHGSEIVRCPEGEVVDLDGEHTMISCGYANVTPWHCPRDVEEDELRQRIEAMVARVPDPSRCVFNLHAPPYDSTLDLAPELDAELKPVLIAGQPKMIPVGSIAVREAIERYQPVVSLHGHIHECRGAVQLGRTTCLNPGSEYSEGILRGVLVHIASGKLLSYQFVAG